MKLCGSVFEKMLKEKKPQLHEHLVGLTSVCDKCFHVLDTTYLLIYMHVYVRILCGNGTLSREYSADVCTFVINC